METAAGKEVDRETVRQSGCKRMEKLINFLRRPSQNLDLLWEQRGTHHQRFGNAVATFDHIVGSHVGYGGVQTYVHTVTINPLEFAIESLVEFLGMGKGDLGAVSARQMRKISDRGHKVWAIPVYVPQALLAVFRTAGVVSDTSAHTEKADSPGCLIGIRGKFGRVVAYVHAPRVSAS